MRIILSLIGLLVTLATLTAAPKTAPKATPIRKINAIEADRICQSLKRDEITKEVYDLTGTIAGINTAEASGEFIKVDMNLGNEDAIQVYCMANFDSVAHFTRGQLQVGDTITVRTRLQNYRGLSCSYYGYLLELHKFVDPIPELIRAAKDKEWQLIAHEQKEALKHRYTLLIAVLWFILLSILIFLYTISRRRLNLDLLTKLNTRFYGEKLINKTLKQGKSGYLCILDLDKFRILNEEYGMDAGDECLIKYSQALKEHFAGNIILRLGGDEFAVYVNECPETEFEMMMNEFFAKLDDIHLTENPEFCIRTSVGAIHHFGILRATFSELYIRADKALYESKKAEGSKLTMAPGN